MARCADDCDPPDDEHLFRASAPPSSTEATPGNHGVWCSAGRQSLDAGRQSGFSGFPRCTDHGSSAKDEIKPAELEQSPTIPGWTDGWTGTLSASSTAKIQRDGLAAWRRTLEQHAKKVDKSRTPEAPASVTGNPFACGQTQGATLADAASNGQSPGKKPDKSRTLKYSPPPQDNHDLVSVDVIEHGSEVLIVRRDPSPLRVSGPNSTLLAAGSCNSAHSPESRQRAKATGATAPLGPPTGVTLATSLKNHSAKEDDASL